MAMNTFGRCCAVWGLAGALALPVMLDAQGRPQEAVAPAQPTTADEQDAWTPWSGRYRITPSDVLELTFPHVPEFNQLLMVQPDGYISLRAVGDIRVQGRTLPELQLQLYEAYEPILREPAITIVLKEFEKPFFTVAGEVRTPGKFELRGALTLTQALAVAGGFTGEAKTSQVVLFRRYLPELLEVKQVDVRAMFERRNLDEDHLIRPGDTILVPRSLMAQLGRFIPTPGLGLYLNPIP